MNIADITKLAGAHKRRRRVGRGTGTGRGKTCGRGHKGLGQRAGGTTRRLFEGGSTPLFLRLPKVGFNNYNFARRFHIVNIGDLESTFDDGATVTTQGLVSARLIPDDKQPVKVLGEGTLTRKFSVEAQKFSASAAKGIEAAGGQATVVPRK